MHVRVQDLRDWLASVGEGRQQQQGDGVLGAVAVMGPTEAGEVELSGGAGGRAGQEDVAALARQRREELVRVCGRIVGQAQGQD